LGVDLIVLGFPAVDGFHVQGVAEHEGNPFTVAQIGNPIPGEDALHRHRDMGRSLSAEHLDPHDNSCARESCRIGP
jgi:hypothetical protein